MPLYFGDNPIKKLCRNIGRQFRKVATFNDLFLQGNFQNTSPSDALRSVETLFYKLKRISQQIDNEDHKDPSVFKLIQSLSHIDDHFTSNQIDKRENHKDLDGFELIEILSHIDNHFTSNQIDKRKYHDLRYSDVFVIIQSTFDTLDEEDKKNHAIQRIKTPFDILVDWYDKQDPEIQDFCERFIRRYKKEINCPFLHIRSEICTLKSGTSIAMQKLLAKKSLRSPK